MSEANRMKDPLKFKIEDFGYIGALAGARFDPASAAIKAQAIHDQYMKDLLASGTVVYGPSDSGKWSHLENIHGYPSQGLLINIGEIKDCEHEWTYPDLDFKDEKTCAVCRQKFRLKWEAV